MLNIMAQPIAPAPRVRTSLPSQYPVQLLPMGPGQTGEAERRPVPDGAFGIGLRSPERLLAPRAHVARPPERAEPVIGCAWPLVWGAAASLGKLVAAIGASAAVRARYDGGTADLAVAGVLLAVGLGTAVVAAWQFGRDAHTQLPMGRAWGLKAVSVSAALCLAGGAAVLQLSISAQKPRLVWLAMGLGLSGYGLVAVSLPNFYACSEAHRGRAVLRHREPIRQTLAALGFGVGFAWAADVGPKTEMPPYVGAAVLTLAATSMLLSLGLATSDGRYARRDTTRTPLEPPDAGLVPYTVALVR